jgi:hypothetical protein
MQTSRGWHRRHDRSEIDAGSAQILPRRTFSSRLGNPTDRRLGQHLTIDLPYADYEFRVEGTLSTWFLVGTYTPHVEHRYDATNRYRVNLSDATAPVLPATADDWSAATVVPLSRKSIFPAVGTLAQDQDVVFNGFRFPKSGSHWPGQQYDVASRLSPDSALVVLQSVTDAGSSEQSKRGLNKVFLDVFNADTGNKVVTIDAIYSSYFDDPGGTLRKTAWLTERYFIVPLGEHRERFVVCEFPPRGRHR